jgi:hypothetical protein
MEPETTTETIGLLDAVIRWCDSALVAAIRQAEVRYAAMDLAGTGYPVLSPVDALQKPTSTDWMAGGTNYGPLYAAWSSLEHDFRARIERSDMHLTGAAFTTEMKAQQVPIDGIWAAEFKFDWKANTLTLRKTKYVAVRASKSAPTGGVVGQELPPGKWRLRVADVADLDDDVILELLEEHANRVIASKDPHFIAHSKLSFTTLIIRKLKARHKTGEMLNTLLGEATELVRWIAAAASGHQTPKAKTIKNHISTEYSRLKT